MFIEKPATNRSINRRRRIYGVGINDSTYITCYVDTHGKKQTCPYYSVWMSMLSRCYSTKFINKNPTYAGCTVAKEWHLFSKFRSWMELHEWQGNSLDKDLKIDGNKEYSPTACMFVPKHINNLFGNHKAGRGLYPQGVALTGRKENKCYKASISIHGKTKNLGHYATVQEAEFAYAKARIEYVRTFYETVELRDLRAALHRKIHELTRGLK